MNNGCVNACSSALKLVGRLPESVSQAAGDLWTTGPLPMSKTPYRLFSPHKRTLTHVTETMVNGAGEVFKPE